MLNAMLMSIYFLLCIYCYVVYMISCVEIEVWEEVEWVSIVFLSEQGFLQGVQLKSSARSALIEGFGSLTFVLIHLGVRFGYMSRESGARAKESLSCETEWIIEGLFLQVYAKSKELNA